MASEIIADMKRIIIVLSTLLLVTIAYAACATAGMTRRSRDELKDGIYKAGM